MSVWYYVHNGQSLGPIELEALRQQRREGPVDDVTLVWTKGMPSWSPYGKVPWPRHRPSPLFPLQLLRNLSRVPRRHSRPQNRSTRSANRSESTGSLSP